MIYWEGYSFSVMGVSTFDQGNPVPGAQGVSESEWVSLAVWAPRTWSQSACQTPRSRGVTSNELTKCHWEGGQLRRHTSRVHSDFCTVMDHSVSWKKVEFESPEICISNTLLWQPSAKPSNKEHTCPGLQCWEMYQRSYFQPNQTNPPKILIDFLS